jgi:hypothetical protein
VAFLLAYLNRTMTASDVHEEGKTNRHEKSKEAHGPESHHEKGLLQITVGELICRLSFLTLVL